MATWVGAKWFGSLSWGAGEQAEARYIFAGDKSAHALSIAASGPTYPTVDTMITSDETCTDFSTAAILVKTTKVVHSDAMLFETANGAERFVWLWGGIEGKYTPLGWYGSGNGAIFGTLGTNPYSHFIPGTDTDFVWNSSTGAFLEENTTILVASANPYSNLVSPYSQLGCILKLKPKTAHATLTGTNTWNFELWFAYGK